MRVITSYGLGLIDPKAIASYHNLVKVRLDQPHPAFNRRDVVDMGREEVFLWSETEALLRVVHIEPTQYDNAFPVPRMYMVNLQFMPESRSAAAELFAICPQNETRVFFNLVSGAVEISQPLDCESERMIHHLNPWVDRWLGEPLANIEPHPETELPTILAEFKREHDIFPSGGIMVTLVWHAGANQLLGFRVTVPPPTGILFERQWALPRSR